MNVRLVARAVLFILFFLNSLVLPAQVRIRLFSAEKPELLIFTVENGRYELSFHEGEKNILEEAQTLIISKQGDRLAVKLRNIPGFYADSVNIRTTIEGSSFTLATEGEIQKDRSYPGDLTLVSDLGTILAINSCNPEDYIAGVVQAEAGNGRYPEFFRTQAVIARTYMYRNLHRHALDGFDLCDDTHCQVYFGTANNKTLLEAAESTKNLVIVDNSGMLINPAFHSNCGGETSPAEFVWLAPEPYLKKVRDPYCHGRENSKWQKTLTVQQWTEAVSRTDHQGRTINIGDASFNQAKRAEMYKAGSVSVPFSKIREELGLKSAFFSVSVEGNKVVLKGRGYGHGIGLCQEGAIVMAGKGFDFRKIIDFYYSGVKIEDISNVVAPEKVLQ